MDYLGRFDTVARRVNDSRRRNGSGWIGVVHGRHLGGRIRSFAVMMMRNRVIVGRLLLWLVLLLPIGAVEVAGKLGVFDFRCSHLSSARVLLSYEFVVEISQQVKAERKHEIARLVYGLLEANWEQTPNVSSKQSLSNFLSRQVASLNTVETISFPNIVNS